MTPQYLTDKQVAERYQISRPSVWRWARDGLLPPPERLGPNTQRWRVATLEAHDEQRAETHK